MTRPFRPLLPLLLLAPIAAEAQRIDGVIRHPTDTAGAAGVLVTAHDGTGAVVAETVTRDNGRFVLYVDSVRTFTLRAHRVGFRPTDLGERTLAEDGVDSLDARLGTEATALPATLPRGASSCGRADARRALVLDLLEEARKAMVAARFRIGRIDLDARWVGFQHRTAKNGEDTLRSTLRRGSGPLPSPFTSVAIEQLQRSGYFATVAGERTFFAPDLDVLLSPWFGEAYCFTLRRTTADSVVLGFAPARPDHRRVDITGEFILARRSLALRRVRVNYIGLPPEERQSDAGGHLDFMQAPNGNWHVAYWVQRTPFLGYRQADGTTTFIRSSMTVVDVIAHFSTGGQVLAITDGGTLRFQRDGVSPQVAATPFGRACQERAGPARSAAVQGRLPADSNGVPRAGVVVRATWEVPVVVARTELATRENVRETRTDRTGAWTLCDLPVQRDLIIRWEVADDETQIPIRLETPFTLVEVAAPPEP